VTILVVSVLRYSTAFSETEQTSISFNDWETIQALLDDVHALDGESVANLDLAGSIMDRVTFGMGMLLSDSELAALIENLEGGGRPLDALTLAKFWLEYGDERTARRIGEVNSADIESHVLAAADDERVLARVVALALLAERPPDRQEVGPLSPERVYAVNELAIEAGT
jgi:hypothetical protein